jgi:hypothetical protein
LTLTSKSAEIGLSMVGANNTMTRGLSWFRPWAIRPVGVHSWRCIAWHRGARRGELQAKRERRRSLQVPEGLLRISANIVDEGGKCEWVAICRPPAARGPPPPFIGQGEAVYSHAARL